ncbi:MAG TPA: hypothetical protein VL354_19365 [Spirochaetia bacterium]|nr:hypothetical protein [Spirochaetia bacterium]
MKRRPMVLVVRWLVLAVSAGLALSGCTTVSAPHSTTDTLLVVSVGLDRSAAGNWDGQLPAKYVLKIKSVSDPSVRADLPLDPNGVYAFTQGLPPGHYTIEEMDFVEKNGTVKGTWPIGTHVELEARRLTIADLSCVYRISSQANLINYQLLANRLSVATGRKLLGALKADGTLAGWKLSETTESLPAIQSAQGAQGKQSGPATARWAQTANASQGNFQLFAVAVDAAGDVYTVGQIHGTDPIVLSGSVATRGAASRNLIIAKYARNGVALWARSTASGRADSWFNAVAADPAGNIYAAGVIRGSDTTDFGNGVSARANGSNLLLVKYDSSGRALWAQTAASSSAPSWISSLAVDKAGNVFAAGATVGSGALSLGNGTTVSGAYKAGDNILLVKYDSTGKALWARSASDAGNQSWLNGVAVDPDGNPYAVGAIRGTDHVQFGPQVTVSGTNAARSGATALLLTYSKAGEPQWARTVETGAGLSYFRSVVLDAAGNVFACGAVHGKDSFDFGNQAVATGTFETGDNVVVVKYSPLGVPQWAQSVMGAGASSFASIAVDATGSVYAAGSMSGSGEYVFGTAAAVQGDYPNGSNVVLVKYDTNGQAMWAQTVRGGANASWFAGVAAGDRGSTYAVGTVAGINRFDFGNGAVVAGTYAQKEAQNPVLVQYAGQ